MEPQVVRRRSPRLKYYSISYEGCDPTDGEVCDFECEFPRKTRRSARKIKRRSTKKSTSSHTLESEQTISGLAVKRSNLNRSAKVLGCGDSQFRPEVDRDDEEPTAIRGLPAEFQDKLASGHTESTKMLTQR